MQTIKGVYSELAIARESDTITGVYRDLEVGRGVGQLQCGKGEPQVCLTGGCSPDKAGGGLLQVEGPM